MGGGGGERVGSKGSSSSAASSIPAAARKTVQSLKEIVNCGDLEIYAMLKDCNMDPDEAVNRLFSQDSFHEVKNKREKKKEMKEIPESRPRAINSSSTRGSRAGLERGGRNSSTHFTSNDYGVGLAKPSKKDNEAHTVPTSSFTWSNIAGNNINRRSTGLSESVFIENTIQTTVVGDDISKFQHNWVGMSPHLSMADIVKMGRPQGKTSSTPIPNDMICGSHNVVIPSSTSYYDANTSAITVPPSESYQEFHSSQNLGSQVNDISHNDWSFNGETPIGSCLTVKTEASGSYAYYVDPSTSSTSHDEVGLQLNPQVDEIHVQERNVNCESLPKDSIISADEIDVQIQIGSPESPDDNFQENEGLSETMSSFQTQRCAFEHEEVEEVNAEISSAATNLQNLRLIKDEPPVNSAVDNPAVIIPSHLQVTDADYSFLSFGSFGSGINTTFSGIIPSKSLKNNMETTLLPDDTGSVNYSDTRNLEYYDNRQTESTTNENTASGSATNTRNYDMPSVSQPEASENNRLDDTHGLQYDLPSVSGYAYSTTRQQNTAAYPYPQVNSQIQSFAPFSSLMPYTNSLPSTLLAPNVQSLREFESFDLPMSPLLPTQPMPTNYSTTISSVSGPTNSMPEIKPGVLSSPQPTQQTLPGTSIAIDSRLTQHLPMHPYSQPTLPLGPFANMISYPYLPQSYTYLPTAAFQQAYTSNGSFHQSPTSMHSTGMKYTFPQYKTNVSVTSSPHSPSLASGYGGFGSSTNIPTNFAMNPSTSSTSTTLGFDEALRMQYKEVNNHYPQHQQTENSAMWIQGAGPRMVSALPSSTFYSLQGQSEQSGYRQRHPASNYGNMGYPNLYHSAAGATHEHQENPIEGNSGGPQGLQSQQAHQIWQHGY